jgi:hypothetical protein
MRIAFLAACLSSAFIPALVLAQAPSTGERAGCEPACGSGDVKVLAPPDNPHLRAGGQLGYTFKSSGDIDAVSDFFTPRVEVYVKRTGRIRIPIIGNFGDINFDDPEDAIGKLQELVNSTAGFQVTFSPYLSVDRAGQALGRVVVYTNLGGKFQRLKEEASPDDFVWANQYRASVGVDLSWDIKRSRPISTILEGVYGHLGDEKAEELLGRDKSYVASLEGTVIAPLPSVDNLSLIAQGVALDGGKPMWRVGLLIYTPQKAEP